MAAIWFRLGCELRARWRSWAALSLLMAVSTGTVLFSAAGARRTDSAWRRLTEATNAHHLFVIGQLFDVDLDAVARLPEVEDFARVAYVGAASDVSAPFDISPLLSVDGGMYARIDRPKVLEGRRPDPDRADEVAITPPVKQRYGLGVGDTLTLRTFTPEQFDAVLRGGAQPEPAGPETPLVIVGVEVSAGEGELTDSSRSGHNIHLTPAFARRYGSQVGMGPALAIRLRNGLADQAAFKLGVERIAAGAPVQLTTQTDEGYTVRRSTHTQALALELFAAFAALAAMLAVGQSLSRQAFLEATDHGALRAVGMTRTQLWGAAMVRSGAIGLAGALVAVGLAVAASPLMPVGLARTAEPAPGLRVDWLVMGLGLVVAPTLALALTALPAWRGARQGRGGRDAATGARRAPVAQRIGWIGLPPTVSTGVHLALDQGRGRTSAPTRAAIVGTAFSLAAVTTALGFGATLSRLLATPRLYGWDWDVTVGNPFTSDLTDQVVPVLRDTAAIEAFSVAAAAEVEVGGVRTQAYGFDTVRGDVHPPVVQGRAPRQVDEIMVGVKVLRDMGRRIGDRVSLRVGDLRLPYRIVGVSTLPQLSIFEVEALGRGVLLTGDGLRRLVPEAPFNLFPLRWAGGVDQEEATVALRRAVPPAAQVKGAEPPVEIADFGKVDNMPGVLSAVVALGAVASLGHALVTTVRRRRRDLAVLKTLGFVRRQVWATVAWQATTMGGLALALGLPLGVASGRWAWWLFSEDLGIVPEFVAPALGMLVAVPVTLVVANLAAALPGRVAARTPPALVLRSE